TIDRRELKDAMSFIINLVDKEIDKMMRALDKDKSNTIDFEEFVHLSSVQVGSRHHAENIFNRLRKSDRKIIKQEDLKQVAKEYKVLLSDQDIKDMIQCASRK
ncbi:hypothetical protein L7F22_015606, partial [Adiantum nelumboides]|nr:hypothetical protein [Adiantum nelumboides]